MVINDTYKLITKNNKRPILWVALLLLSLSSWLIAEEAFVHDLPTDLYNNQNLTLRIESIDTHDNLEIQCFYKFSAEDNYQSDDLLALSPRLFQIDIPVPSRATGIHYYFNIYKSGQLYATLPRSDARELPYTVLNPKKAVQYLTLLHPNNEKEQPYKQHFLFVLKNNFPHYFKLDKAVLNDDEPLQIIAQSQTVINFKNTFPVRRGKNKVTVIGTLQDGSLIKEDFYFKTRKKVLLKELSYKASTSFSHLLYDTNKSSSIIHDPLELAYSVRADIDSSYGDLNIYALFDNRESSSSQAYHRLTIKAKSPNDNVNLQLGDSSINYSSLTLSGRRTRGLFSEVNLLGLTSLKSRLNLNYLSGNTSRSISVSSGNTTIGTYKQRLNGVQLKYHGFNSNASLQFLHAKDIVNSLSTDEAGTATPIENFVLSTYVDKQFSPLTRFNTEFAGALYYSDSTAPTINSDDVDIPDILADRVPLKTSMTFGVASKSELQFPVFSKNSVMKIGYDYILPGFTNVVNSSLVNDQSHLSIRHSQKLLNRKWIINSQLQFKNDNIIDSLSETQYSNSYKINSMYQSKRFGSFNSSYLSTNRNNDFSAISTSNTSINSNLNFIMIGFSGIPIKSSHTNGVINANYSISEFSDKVSAANDSTTNSLGLSISNKYNDARLTLGMNQSILKTASTGVTNYVTVYSKINKKINIYTVNAGIKAVYGKNTNDEDAYKVDSTKLTYHAGLSFQKKRCRYFKSCKYSSGFEYLTAQDKLDRDDRNSNYYELYTRFKIENRF